jgi:UDP-glucose 4-epimerase
MKPMRILVTGGTGYIGSHTVLTLLEAGHDVGVVDNLANSSEEALRRVGELAGREASFVRADITDEPALDAVFAEHSPEAVIHFAGLKAVGESVSIPLDYYFNNVAGTIALLRVMERHAVRTIVFSSSATVYGDHNPTPYVEKMEIGAMNPYGRTKEQIEDILSDLGASNPAWRIALLRYFNPGGAHPSGRIGEDPQGIPNNLLPYIAQVAVGRRDKLTVHGDDYPTADGTCERDFIHVEDLAQGHLAALEHLPAMEQSVRAFNLGTGNPTSVLTMIDAFRRASGREIPYEIGPRRAGDLAVSYADPSRANSELGWRAAKTIDDMCADTWRWQSQNPQGYPA